MPRLTDELVRDAFAPLMEHGFSGPDWWLAGTDQMVTFRRDGVEVHLEVEDMGTNLPNAYIRQPDGSELYLTDNSEYPAFSRFLRLWRPFRCGRQRRLMASPLMAEVEREREARVRRLALLAEAHLPRLA
ncbi:MAG: hypothetical protein AAF170_00225 [Bacteroidota bacterium]